jgi:O-antigen/teichoic acid export membrane protein
VVQELQSMMSYLQRARKNIALKFVSEALIRSLAFLLIVVAARYLGGKDYGYYSLAYFFAGLLTIFSDLGLNTVLIRDVSRHHALLERYAGNILSLKLILSVLSLLFGPILLYLLGYSRELILMILLSQIYLQANYLLDFFIALTNSLEKMEYELLIKGLYKILVVTIPIFFLWSGYGLWGLLWALIGAYGISCLLSGWIIWKKITPLRFHFERLLWKKLLRSAWPIGISSLFMTVYTRIDLVMLSLFGISPAEIGWYSIPVKIIEMLSLFPFLIMTGLFPIMAVLTSEDQEVLKRNYHRALMYLVMVAVPLVLFIMVLSDSWLILFFGSAFVNSIPSLKILVGVVPFTFINYVLIYTLIALNQEKMITWGSGLAVLFNIGINILVLPKYGYLGASATTVITEVLLSVYFFWFLQRSFSRLPLFRIAIKLGISGALMALPLWGLKSWPPGLVLAMALAGYVLGLFLFRLITREDWLLAKRLLSRPAFNQTGG